MDKNVFDPIANQSAKVAYFFKNLVTGETLSQNENMPLLAASVIKLAVLTHVFTLLDRGELDNSETFIIRESDKLPSCGALNCMHAGLSVTLQDLYTLMITLSDNSATNLLIKRLGMAEINATMNALGCTVTTLNRLMFDSAAAALGKENYISAGEMAFLLEGMYRGTLISPAASSAMLNILKQQKLKGKLPLNLPRGTVLAHKTGEDGSITHDVGIVFAKQPFILCLCANDVDAPSFEMGLHRTARAVFDENNG